MQIQVHSADHLHGREKVAGTRSSTPGPDGGHVPGGLAGYTHDGAAYCPDCADDVTATAPGGDGEIPLTDYPAFETDPRGFGVGIINGFDEADYPGFTCDVCLKVLDTNVLVYENGPGADHFDG